MCPEHTATTERTHRHALTADFAWEKVGMKEEEEEVVCVEMMTSWAKCWTFSSLD
jgi:hypothetical protein